MEDSLDKDTSSSKKYTQQFARPISDYYLSKANKKKNDLKKNQINQRNIQNLYQDALERFSKQELALQKV